VIEAEAVAVSGLPVGKVAVTTTVKVPFTLKVWDRVFGFVAPPAIAPVPSPKFQEKAVGAAPVDVAVKDTAVPTVPVAGALVRVTAFPAGGGVTVTTMRPTSTI
jgi:hypothetical protein